MELYSEDELMPKRGNFFIIRNNLYRVSLIHDFTFLEENKAWWFLDSVDEYGILDFLRSNFYYLHCDTTFKKNIESLKFIKKRGWAEFIINYLNENFKMV